MAAPRRSVSDFFRAPKVTEGGGEDTKDTEGSTGGGEGTELRCVIFDAWDAPRKFFHGDRDCPLICEPSFRSCISQMFFFFQKENGSRK